MELDNYYSKINSLRDNFGRPITLGRFLNTEDDEFDRKQIEELHRLRKEVARKRRQDEIDRLKRELTGGFPYYL